MTNLSPSGARIRGDEYQHLVSWIQVLKAILPKSGVVEIGIEDPDGGNADDVTVRKCIGPHEFTQAKSAVAGQEKANAAWLMEPSKSGGPSIIQGLFKVWRDYKNVGIEIKITLHTNRPPDCDDNFIALRDGKTGTVGPRLRQASSKAAKKVRNDLRAYLGATEEEFFDFLDHLRFITGRLYEELREEAKPLMYAVGFRYDDEAVTLGESIVRKWVTDGKRRLTMSEIENETNFLLRPNELPSSILLIQALDRDPSPDAATIALDWVDCFEGEEARTRRIAKDPTFWNLKFRKEIQDAARSLRASGATRVLVRGHMRLPSWFAVGVELGRTAGFGEVVTFQGMSPWSSKGELTKFPVEMICDEKLSDKNELAVSIAVSVDPTQDVRRYLGTTANGIGTYLCLAPTIGIGNNVIGGDNEARHCAFSLRDTVRSIVQKQQPTKIHLFLAVPRGLALLLGHLWDRMPPTQLYEDPGALGDYTPSFLIPN